MLYLHTYYTTNSYTQIYIPPSQFGAHGANDAPKRDTMPRIPRTPHVRTRPPNTDKQRRIIEAVEELYPEYDLSEIARLYEGENGEGRSGLWNELSEDEKEKLEPMQFGPDPEDKGVHPSTVSRTINEFMEPEDQEEWRTEDSVPQNSTNGTDTKAGSEFSIPSEAPSKEYAEGLAKGIEIGFYQGVEWAERRANLSEGSLTDDIGDIESIDIN